MASGGQDGSVQRAAEQIRRKLLRDEARLHAERAEVERLKATGWRPPHARRERSGSTVADATRAIEAMETEKEAYDEEARRRLVANTVPATELHLLVPPASSEDRQRLDRYLDAIEEKVKAIERDARALGMTNAANAFQRYLSRTGGTVYLRPEDLRRYPVLQDAERGVQKHFLDWILYPKVEKKVSVTRGGPVVQTVVSPWERLGEELTNLADGQTIARSSYWDSKFQYPPKWLLGLETLTDSPEANAELFAFAGDAFLRGDGNFTFTRNGDQIDFEGFVHHKFDQPYDYETGPTFYAPKTGGLIEGLLPHALTGEEGLLLAQYGRAKPFQMQSGWQQRVTGKLRVDPSGRLVLDQEPVWTNINPR